MDIVVLKLITGEEILAELVVMNGDDRTVVRNPVSIAIVRGSNGQPNVGFAPFPLHAEQKKDSNFFFKNSSIAYTYTPAEDFINNYNQVFGSGIVVPSKQLITG